MKHPPFAPAPRPCGRHFLRWAASGLLWSVLLLLLGLATAPAVAATFTVSNTNDSGTGSLRAAITAANSSAGSDTIDATGIDGTITLESPLPDLSSNISLNGPGSSLLRVHRSTGTAAFRIFIVSSGATVTLSGLHITNGLVDDDFQVSLGGGIRNDGTLTVSHCTLSQNSGGIQNHGALTVNNSTLSDNSAEHSGGAIANYEGTLTVNNSTLSANYAYLGGAGGGIFNYRGTVTVNNSTLSDNQATEAGGGIFNTSGGTLTVNNSTLSHNRAEGETTAKGGGIFNREDAGTATVRNSIIALNSATTSGPDVSGTFTSNGYNLIGVSNDSSGFTHSTDQSGTTATPLDPQMGPLKNNGGPTFTHALLSGSPALDKGKRFGSPLPTTDQRGLPRPVDLASIANASGGDGSDIGAVEVQAAPPPSPGSLQFSAATYSVNEGAGTATISVTRSGGSVGAVSVQYATSNGTATAPADYSAKSGTLSWAAGDSASKSFTVSLVNDAVDEVNETLNLTLSNPAGGAALGSPNPAVLAINDDDEPLPSLSINNVSVTEGNVGTVNATVTVSLSGASSQTVTVQYATSNGTATAPADYVAKALTTLSFSPGQTSKTVTVVVNGDTVDEVNETFRVNLSNASNATIADNQGVGTILDDDAAPGGVAPVNVSLSPGSGSSAPGTARLFTAVYSDANGSSNIERAYLRVGRTNANSLLGYYHPGRNKLYLLNDAGTAFLGGFAPGSNNVISNRQGTLNCANTSVTKSGNSLTVRWSFTPSGAWSGTTQDLFLYVEDVDGLFDGYANRGTWTISGNVAPVNVSLTPNSGSSALGNARLFTAIYSDGDGASNIERAYLRIGSSNSNALLGYYHPIRNKLYLMNDDHTAFLGGFAPGSNNVISNSQGTLNCANTTVSTSGNSLTVKWSFTPAGTWAGTRQLVYLYVEDVGGLFDGYDPMGSWTITSG